MSLRGPERAAVALALAVLLVGGAAIALVDSAPARAATAVRTDASDAVSVTAVSGFSFTPNAVQGLPTNATITLTFTDSDSLDHTFWIIGKQGWVIPPSYSSGQLEALAFGHLPPALVGANASANGGQNITTFTSPSAPGWYEFVCTEPGHFQNGMYGFIAFGMNLPGNLTVSAASTNPGAAVFIIVGVIVGLVVIALVLGFVVGRRRGATYEMPPERLGYPEPESPSEPESPTGAHEPPG
ncbi:MAG TPA: sulfocyanin-like copper-binding protein [Thermoplasmata archaeon]|nr:sulfocyanin-like copper-binding protein [Thermoplasmata archaeon]